MSRSFNSTPPLTPSVINAQAIRVTSELILGENIISNNSIQVKKEIIIEDPGSGTETVTIRSPDPLVTSYSLTLPPDNGNIGEVLGTDGSGVLSWVTVGGSGTPGTPFDSIQFNSVGVFSGSSTLTFDGANAISFGTEALVSTITAPNSSTTIGGGLGIIAGTGAASSDGGVIEITAGNSGVTTGDGGDVNISGGDSFDITTLGVRGGDINLTSGDGYFGGEVNITGGVNLVRGYASTTTTSPTSTTTYTYGGRVNISTVDSTNAGSGSGDINIITGNVLNGGVKAGDINIKVGNGNVPGNIILQSGQASGSSEGGLFQLTGGRSSGSGDGGRFILTGGSNTGTGNGGDILMRSGSALGTGTGGNFLLSTGRGTGSPGGNITLLPSTIGTDVGSLVLGDSSSKLSLFNVTPVVRPTIGGTSAIIAGGGGGSVDDNTTFDGYTLSEIVSALRELGILT